MRTSHSTDSAIPTRGASSVVPGGYFFAVPIGHTGADDRVTISTPFPSDPSLQGFVLNLQALVLADSSMKLLTNAISRVVSE
ncbi:MAG: hypothetical protein AB1486_05905 [Planctomycetota bacterium]